MRRRKKKEEHRTSHERWLISYADFITLLFAFFVVLYASSQVDKRKVGRLAMAIQVAFQELGVFDTSNTHIPLSDMEAIPFANVQAVQNVERTADLERIVQPMKGILAPTSTPTPLKDIQAELEKALAPEIKKHVVDIKPKKEGLVVSLREMGFYESGSSTMRASSVEAVDRLAQVIIPRTENLRSKATRTIFRSTMPISHPIGSFPPLAPPSLSACSSSATAWSPIAFPPRDSPNTILWT